MVLPPDCARVFAVIASPSVSASAESTVYENTREVVPEPLAYEAFLLERPASGTTGVPVTFTVSEKLTVTEIVSPIL